MKVLVTGGAGFIGSHVVDSLLRNNNPVICLDNFDPYYDIKIKRGNIAPFLDNNNFYLIEGDVKNKEILDKIISDHNVEYIVHEAAQPGVRASVSDPLKSTMVNIVGTLSILQASVDSSVKKIINASSSSIYGKVKYLPFDENHPKEPLSPYGASKLAAEQYCNIFSELYGLDIVSLRYFTVYGPGIRPDLAISIFTEKAMNNEIIPIYGDGTRTRGFTHISDVTRATIEAIKRGGGAYNIGEGSRVSVKELANKIITLTRSESKLEYFPAIKGDTEHTQADIKKANKDLNWKPNINLDEGLEKYVNWKMQR
jgi:UDP-glucose 4-epimerase|tara:strand:- start:1745 stop:2680 length:936 start_codon:yes stop_codon:yes gene_type:complete